MAQGNHTHSLRSPKMSVTLRLRELLPHDKLLALTREYTISDISRKYRLGYTVLHRYTARTLTPIEWAGRARMIQVSKRKPKPDHKPKPKIGKTIRPGCCAICGWPVRANDFKNAAGDAHRECDDLFRAHVDSSRVWGYLRGL